MDNLVFSSIRGIKHTNNNMTLEMSFLIILKGNSLEEQVDLGRGLVGEE